jgi:pimeloyl-ACP methyl ester carboxylesterase
MDILAPLPDTHAGRHTRWLWSRMLAIAVGGPQLDAAELADHFAPSVFDYVPAEHLVAHFAQLAPTMPLVTHLAEEPSSGQRYSALLGLPNSWLRYTCLVQDDEPHLLIEAAYSQALGPNSYSDQRVQRHGRDVQIRDFGGTGPLMLLWHGAGCDLASWETLVPDLAGFHIVAQDLPGHGRSPLKVFTSSDALADADAVVAELGLEPPIVVGHSLGGYLGLRYAATRTCAGWIGLDGPFGLVYPWKQDDPRLLEMAVQICREIRAIEVASDLAAMSCPAMLMLCMIAANPLEEPMVPARRDLAEHIARCHSEIRIEWVQTGHDTIMFNRPKEIAATIRDFLRSYRPQRNAESGSRVD